MFFASSRSSPSHVGNVRQDGLRHRWQQAGTARRGLEQDEAHDDQSRVREGFRRKEHARAFECRWDGRELVEEVRRHAQVEGHDGIRGHDRDPPGHLV